MHASLEALVQESANPLIKSLFSGKNSNTSSKGKLNFISVGSKFKTQLAELMEKLERNVSNSLIATCLTTHIKLISNDVKSILSTNRVRISYAVSNQTVICATVNSKAA